MAKEKWYLTEQELDTDQRHIKNLPSNNSYIIEGCAGSGKTILALHKAKFHQENGDDYYFIVYTVSLMKFIEDGVRDLGIDTARVLHYEVWKGLRNKSANYIIVDEAQDFTEEEILEMNGHAKKSIVFFGDSAQQIYEGKVTMKKIEEITKHLLWSLHRNYRLPKTIARFAQAIPSTADDLARKCTKEGTSLPSLIEFGSLDAELDFIIATIKKYNLTDVGILVPKNKQAEYIYKYFLKHKLSVEFKFKDSNKITHMTLDFTTNNPKIVTYHSAKGLQFEAVFLPFCGNSTGDFFRSALYVAATRVYKDLYLTYSEDFCRFLSNISPKLYEFESTKRATKKELPF